MIIKVHYAFKFTVDKFYLPIQALRPSIPAKQRFAMGPKSTTKSSLPQVVLQNTTSRLTMRIAAAIDRVRARETPNTSSSPPTRPPTGRRTATQKETFGIEPNTALVPPPFPPAPRTPYSWIWRCHECGSEHPLACTRRCLNCSHSFCVAPAPGKASSTASKRKKKSEVCTAKFDYSGWAAWGAYRRSVAAIRARHDVVAPKPESATSRANSNRVSPKKRKRSFASGLANHDTFAAWGLVTENCMRHDRVIRRSVWRPLPKARLEEVRCRKETVYDNGQHSCWRHCDFPSECLHTIQAAACGQGQEISLWQAQNRQVK
jgi:hypothetical protein